jgi:hypothetical protein
MTSDHIPDGIETLKTLLRARDTQIGRLQDVVDSQKAVIIATGKAAI